MDKILEELRNMEEINSDFKKNLENELAIKNKDEEIKAMYENVQLKMIGTVEREQALKEYEEKKNKLEKIKELKKAGDNEIEEKFKNKKKAIIEEIDKRLENYEKIEQEKEKMEEAKKERDEEVLKLESQKNAYSKIAQNSKKDIANILEKLNNGERVSMDRLTDAQNEYKANVSKVIGIENRIKELNDKEFEISEDIEKNPEEISDLQYLKSRIVGIKISELDKIKEDPFVEKYGKEETKDENDKLGENFEKGSNDGKDKSGENSGKDSNDENDKLGGKTSKSKDTIVLDAYNNKIVVNGIRKDYLEVFRKDGKKLKEDSDLAIGSLFAGDKKMAKYIDYGLLKVLDDKDRNLALEYLNVIRGGGIKSSSESAEILKNAIDIKYKFNNDLNTFFSFRKKRIARKAVELGIAEIDGISDKSLAQRLKESLSKVKNVKLFNVKQKPKALVAKLEEQVQKNGLGELKVDNRDNRIEKKAQEKRKQDVEKIKSKEAVKSGNNSVEVIPPENNGHEIDE